MAFATIIYTKSGPVAEIRFNRPHRLNAVVSEFYAEILTALDDAEADSGIRCIVLTGEGRAFCVGADLKEHGAATRSELEKLEYLQLANDVCDRIYRHPRPVIAAVNGFALGAGAEMSCSADFILMKASARIGWLPFASRPASPKPAISSGEYSRVVSTVQSTARNSAAPPSQKL